MKPTRPRDPGSHYDAVVRMFSQYGGVEASAHALGKTPATLYGYSSDSGNGEMSVLAACQLSRLFPEATAIAEHVAACAGGVFLPMPAPGEGVLAKLNADFAAEAGRSLSDWITAVLPDSDGGTRITPKERREGLKHTRALMRIVAAIEAKLNEEE